MPTTALLLMDLQTRILERFEVDPGFVPRINAAAATARSAGFPVLWVKVGFRSGFPEVSLGTKPSPRCPRRADSPRPTPEPTSTLISSVRTPTSWW